MTPRERVSDHELDWTIQHAGGTVADFAVDLFMCRREAKDLRARLARIEAWAARARDGIWSGLTSMQRESVLRDYPDPTPGRDAPATSVPDDFDISGAFPDDAPATSEGEAAGVVQGAAAPSEIAEYRPGARDPEDPPAPQGDMAGSPGDAAVPTAEGRTGSVRDRAPSSGSEADAAADRLRAALPGLHESSDGFVYGGMRVAVADIRAVLDSRDAARDEAARRGAALESLIVAAKEATQRFFNESSMLVPADEVVEITGPLDDAANRARAALAPASAAPQERPE